MIIKMWREEFRVEKFKLTHPTPGDFTICCWQKGKNPTAAWLAYRTLIALYFLATFIYVLFFSIIDPEHKPSDKYKFFIFLTNWTYTLETFMFCLADIMTILAFRRNREVDGENSKNEMPQHYKIFWVIYTTVLSSSVLVTILFWIAVYDPALHTLNDRNIMVHVFNSVFMVLDFILVAHPIRFLHFYLPDVYALVYLVFSVIYELSGGTGIKGIIPIYKVLDWKNEPKRAVQICLVACAGLLFVHIMFSLLSMVKLGIKRVHATD